MAIRNASSFDYLKHDATAWDNGYGFCTTGYDTGRRGASCSRKGNVTPSLAQISPNNPAWNYMFAMAYIFMYFVSTFGNGLVIYLFTKTKNLRSPANMLIVNLAVADFFMMQTQAPMFVVSAFSSRWWIFSHMWCKIYAFAGSITGIGAIVTMVFIGYDRYNVIVKGMSGQVVTRGKAAMFIIFAWLYANAISLPPLLGVWGDYKLEGMLSTCSYDYLTESYENRTFAIFMFVGAFVLPLMMLMYYYSQIVNAVWSHEKALREQAKKMNVTSLRSNADANAESAEMRIAKVAVTNVMLWVCIWTPYAMVSMLGAFGDREFLTPLVGQLPPLCAKFASCLNPIVYAISHPRFRVALKNHLPWMCIYEPEVKPSSNDTSSEKTITTS